MSFVKEMEDVLICQLGKDTDVNVTKDIQVETVKQVSLRKYCLKNCGIINPVNPKLLEFM